jgi:hypothetical protein
MAFRGSSGQLAAHRILAPASLVREDWLDRRKEPALEPELPIVDPHHHLWVRPRRCCWMTSWPMRTAAATLSLPYLCKRSRCAESLARSRASGRRAEFVNGMRQRILRHDKGGRRYADLSLGGRVEPVLTALLRRGRRSIPRLSLHHGLGRRYFTQQSKLSGMNANTRPRTTPNRVGRRYAASRLLTANSEGSCARPSSRGSPLGAAPRRPQARRGLGLQRNAHGDLALARCSAQTSRQLRKLVLPSRFTLFETASKTRLLRALHTGVLSHGFCTRDFSASSMDSESRERFGLWKGSLSKTLPHLVRIYFTSAAARISFSGVVS